MLKSKLFYLLGMVVVVCAIYAGYYIGNYYQKPIIQIVEKEIQTEVEVEKIVYKDKSCFRKDCLHYINECIGTFAYKAITSTPEYKAGSIFIREASQTYYDDFCFEETNEKTNFVNQRCYSSDKILDTRFFKPVY